MRVHAPARSHRCARLCIWKLAIAAIRITAQVQHLTLQASGRPDGAQPSGRTCCGTGARARRPEGRQSEELLDVDHCCVGRRARGLATCCSASRRMTRCMARQEVAGALWLRGGSDLFVRVQARRRRGTLRVHGAAHWRPLPRAPWVGHVALAIAACRHLRSRSLASR